MTDHSKLNIRPQIKTINNTKNTTSIEHFQNTTLRPILKLQNDLITKIMQDYLKSKKIDIQKMLKPESEIKQLITQNNQLHQKLKMLVIAHFTLYEYEIYTQHSKEFNKRITSMLVQRTVDNIILLKLKLLNNSIINSINESNTSNPCNFYFIIY